LNIFDYIQNSSMLNIMLNQAVLVQYSQSCCISCSDCKDCSNCIGRWVKLSNNYVQWYYTFKEKWYTNKLLYCFKTFIISSLSITECWAELQSKKIKIHDLVPIYKHLPCSPNLSSSQASFIFRPAIPRELGRLNIR
jgi:hypothetical protein